MTRITLYIPHHANSHIKVVLIPLTNSWPQICKRQLVRRFDVDGNGVLDMDDVRLGLSRSCPSLAGTVNHFVSSQKVRTVVTLYQIVSPMAFNLGVTFPAKYTEAVSSLVVVNLDLLPSLNLACLYNFDYIRDLYVTTLWPIAVSFVLLIVAPLLSICRGTSYAAASLANLGPVLTMSFFLFISTSAKVLSFFKCDEFADTGERFLEVDYSVDCDGDRYKGTMAFALLGVAIYPIGIPCLYFMLTFSKRAILRKPVDQRTEAEQASVANISFLVASYKPAYWFFETIECFRKLLLTSALLFISPGSATQGVSGVLMSTLSLRLYIGCKQFPDPSDNRLGELAQWQVFCTFFAALMIMVDVTSNISSYDKVIFENLLLAILFFAPAVSFLEPVMKYICGKPLKLANINMGTFGLAPPPMPTEMKQTMEVVKQISAANEQVNHNKQVKHGSESLQP